MAIDRRSLDFLNQGASLIPGNELLRQTDINKPGLQSFPAGPMSRPGVPDEPNQSFLQQSVNPDIGGNQLDQQNQTLNPVDQFNSDVKSILSTAQGGGSTPTAQQTAPAQQTAAPKQTTLTPGQTSSSGATVNADGDIVMPNGQTISKLDTNTYNQIALQEGFQADTTPTTTTPTTTDTTNPPPVTNEGVQVTNVIPLGDEDALIAERNRLINLRFNTLAEQEIQAGLTNVEDLQRQTSELIIKGSQAISDITPEELRRLSPAQQSQLRQIDRKGIEAQLAGVRTGLQFLGQERANEEAIRARAEAIAMEREKGIKVGNDIINPYTGEKIYEGPVEAGASELNELLSLTEAEKLGVPYGTTKGQAAAMGLIPGSTAGTISAEEIASTKVTIGRIDELLTHEGLNSSVGPLAINRIAIGDLGGAKQDFIAGVQQLVSGKSLEELIAAKARGATFGALSDTEMRILSEAATKIGFWAQTKDGKVTGYATSEEAFLKELNTIREMSQKAVDKAEASSAGSGSPGQPFDEPVDAQGLFSNDLNTSQKGSVAEVSIRKSPVSKRTGDDIECVIYSRMLAPGLPTMGYKLKVGPNNAPLSDADKLRKSQNAQMKRRVIVPGQEAVTNAVAIMPDVGFYGHTANVVTVNENGTITIQEANYRDNMITQRTGTPEALKIEGYWVP